MDFLVAAIYTRASELEEGSLVGALLTKYVPESGGRPYVYFADVDTIKERKGIDPRGFELSDRGILLSDSMCRNEFHEDTVQYISASVGQMHLQPPGLIDVVLYGASSGCSILQNYDACVAGAEEPVVVQMRSIRVSNSSFNLYAPYKKADGKFRTLSLVDITSEEDETIPFVLVVPENAIGGFSGLREYCTALPRMEGIDGELFRVSMPVVPAYTFMGEAFINYLAYQVAFNKLGVEICEQFLEMTKFRRKDQEDAQESDYVDKGRKHPQHNVSIVCSYSNTFRKK